MSEDRRADIKRSEAMNFTLTTIPPSPNKWLRMHWRASLKGRKALKDEYYWEFCRQGGQVRPQFSRARVTIIRYAIRMMDKDNLYGSIKQVIDALRLACIIENDTEGHITLTVTQQRVHKRSEQRVEIEVEEL